MGDVFTGNVLTGLFLSQDVQRGTWNMFSGLCMLNLIKLYWLPETEHENVPSIKDKIKEGGK